MDLVSFSTTIVLVSAVAVLVLAFLAYWSCRAWKKRSTALRNSADRGEPQDEQKFFRLWHPPD
jgi:hypothetical protein